MGNYDLYLNPQKPAIGLYVRAGAGLPDIADAKDWIFDGASMLPDKLMARLLRIPHLTEIALKHDLKYAYGELGNEEERLRADRELKEDLLADGTRRWLAETIFRIVRLSGSERWKTSFSWGFARIRR